MNHKGLLEGANYWPIMQYAPSFLHQKGPKHMTLHLTRPSFLSRKCRAALLPIPSISPFPAFYPAKETLLKSSSLHYYGPLSLFSYWGDTSKWLETGWWMRVWFAFSWLLLIWHITSSGHHEDNVSESSSYRSLLFCLFFFFRCRDSSFLHSFPSGPGSTFESSQLSAFH